MSAIGATKLAEVFTAPAAEYSEPVTAAEASPTEILRVLSVEERAGRERQGELVRVPVFFAAGECRELDQLAIVPVREDGSTGAAIPFQADDVRRAPDGGVSRAHFWFATDIAAGAKQRFHLVRRDSRASPDAPAVELTAAQSELRITTDDGLVAFTRKGALRSIGQRGRAWEFDSEGAFPRVVIAIPAKGEAAASEIVFDRTATAPVVTWGAGPLFAKVRVRIDGADGSALEQDYRITRRGEVTVTATIYPGSNRAGVVKENRLLTGRLKTPGGKAGVARVPAGIRYALRAEHAYVVTALTRSPDAALLAIPLVIGASNGVWRIDDDGNVTLEGHRGLKRGDEGEKDTLHAFWTEVRLVPAVTTAADELWSVYRSRVQPLVAVVEEPSAKLDDLHAALSAVVREMKPIGWRQEAGRALVLGDRDRAAKMLQRTPQPREADEERLIRGAQNATAKLTNNGERKVREHEKGRAYGGLDPYHITYTQSAAAAVVALMDTPTSVGATNLAMARAVRAFGGRVDRAGNPYIDCFNRTLNMQMGPVLFGLTAGTAAGETELARFYRDLATSPPVLSVFGRGQRPYTGAPAKSPDQTDYLYQAICDFWLRTTEVLGQENLQLHPLAYSRYTDCIDVMADRYHGVAAKDKEGATGTPRANFFRGQAHTHRWLGWSCAPYIRLLEDPAERSALGLTEAIHHTRAQKGRWKNWPDLTFYILADLLIREALARHDGPKLPASPGEISVTREGKATAVKWAPVAGAAGYRVYRAENPGGPYVWLNSPYLEDAPQALTGTHFLDTDAPANAAYVVTAVDANGRESPWLDSPQ